MSGPNVATIPCGVPFLDALASWWLARGGDPSRGVFLLPTRRAARGLEEAFLRASDGQPLLLPRIAALGGIDEAPLALSGALAAPPGVDPARRLAVLSRMILAMGGADGALRGADAAWTLAAELAALLDEAARAGVDLAAQLPNATGGEFAAHWDKTLDFLAIVTRSWPEWLREAGLADVAARDIALIAAQAEFWESAPPGLPVVAAGSTGAIPAVAALLRVVSRLPEGIVVLPGLDTELDEASWEALESTHPQAGLRTLLAALGVRRDEVAVWGAESGRAALLRQALLPAASLHRWQEAAVVEPPGLLRLACRDQQEEAVATALVLREALETPGRTAALITPDRALARRVAAELLRFGVVADDSAGERLAEAPAALFLRLIATGAAQGFGPVALLSVLKHPFCAAGLRPASCRREARALELRALRGVRPGLSALARAGESAFVVRIAERLSGLTALTMRPVVAPAEALRALIEAAEAMAATDAESGAARLWQGEEGAALADHLAALLAAFGDLPEQPPLVLPGLLDAALAGIAVRSRRSLRGRDGAEHPRVFIWGLLEARLQAVDVAVVGGLVEGAWPQAADPGPWLNREMRRRVGLPAPEEAVGRAAHDFVAACCAAGVALLSAPERRERAPAVQSRWIMRLEAFLRAQGGALPAHPAAGWAAALDQPARVRPARPPRPAPDVALRPRQLRVTDIETWLRDPYAIYALRVLNLRKLEPLDPPVGAADYGRIVHEGMRLFLGRHGAALPPDAETELCAAMDAALAAAAMPDAAAAWWRPRLHRIAAWVACEERARRARLSPVAILPEVPGEWTFAAPAGPFTLRGRADRIEVMQDGSVAVLDYKTTKPPAAAEIDRGRAPQMPLEAAMLAADAFAGVTGTAAELTFWHISGGHEPGEAATLYEGNPERVRGAAEDAAASLLHLVAAYDDPGRAYLCRPLPEAAPRHGDYVRLSRWAEWGEGVGEE